jgi:Colon cancer-associated protein Mic1-like
VLQYIESLLKCGIEANSYLGELVANLLVQEGAFYQLHQLLDHRILPGTLAVAKLLMCHGALEYNEFDDSNNVKMGIRILKQLGADVEVVQGLLGCGMVNGVMSVEMVPSQNIAQKVFDAVQYASNHRCLDKIEPSVFLEAAYRANDHTLYLNVYRLMEENGLVREGSRFVSVFRELWGPRLDMEEVLVESFLFSEEDQEDEQIAALDDAAPQ